MGIGGGYGGRSGATTFRLPLAPLAMIPNEDTPLRMKDLPWWPPEGWDEEGHWFIGEEEEEG